jgi:hypothetical protein
MSVSVVLFTLAAGFLLALYGVFSVARYVGEQTGDLIRNKTAPRRELLLRRAKKEEEEHGATFGGVPVTNSKREDSSVNDSGIKVDHTWDGVVGFFHPFW